jgi:Arc/MetJ-type ribon-helix-helix transcriptional regulator
MDSVSVTKSIRVSPEMATVMDNLIEAGKFSTTSELILDALAQFLEQYTTDADTRILRLKVPLEVEQRLRALATAGDGPGVEAAAARVLREYTKERMKALVADNQEFDDLVQKLQKRRLDQVAARARTGAPSK